MADWSNDNEAHVVVHGFLGGHLLHNSGFRDAGTLKMKEMTFWHPFAEQARQAEARRIAQGLDQFIRLFAKAEFENEVQPSSAIANIESALLSPEKTMNELADLVDGIYKFKSETA